MNSSPPPLLTLPILLVLVSRNKKINKTILPHCVYLGVGCSNVAIMCTFGFKPLDVKVRKRQVSQVQLILRLHVFPHLTSSKPTSISNFAQGGSKTMVQYATFI